MRRINIISLLLAVLLLTVSCGREGRQADVLSRLDSLVEADADSALRLMGRMQDDGWSRRDAMRLELLRAKAMNRADSLFTTDSLMLRVCRYYRRHGTRNERMLSLYLLGCTYRDMGSAPRAIETWQQAVAKADTNRQDCDLSTLMRIHSQMNELYTRQRLPELAQKESQLAERLCWKMGDTLRALFFERKICEYLFNEGKYYECIQKADSFYHKYLQLGLNDKAALVCIYPVKSYLALGKHAEAKSYMDIYESYILSLPDYRVIRGGIGRHYIYKGQYYLGIGMTDSAESYFRKALLDKDKWNNALLIYKGLYQTFSSKNEIDSTIKYTTLYSEAKEHDFYSANAQAALETKSLYDYSVEQKIAREKTEKLSRFKNIGFVFALIILLILSILGTFFYKEREQNRRLYKLLSQKEDKLIETESKMESAMTREEELRDTLAEVKKQHEGEKANINSQLEAITEEKKALANTTQELREQIGLLRTELGIKEMGERIQALEDSEIVKEIRDFLNNPVGNIKESQWSELAKEVNKTHPTFYSLMHRYKNLDDEDYRICMLTLIGCGSKDINILMGKSSGYSSNRKKDLLKFVFNEEGNAKDFSKKIRTIM